MTKFLLSLAVAISLSLAACGGKSETEPPVAGQNKLSQEAMLVGTWQSDGSATVEQNGIVIAFPQAMIQYNADGTSQGTALMEFQTEQLPEDMRKFNMSATSQWTLIEGRISESLLDAEVVSISGSAQSQEMAKGMAMQMKSGSSSESKIIELSKNRLVLKELESGMEIIYSRQ